MVDMPKNSTKPIHIISNNQQWLKCHKIKPDQNYYSASNWTGNHFILQIIGSVEKFIVRPKYSRGMRPNEV